MLSIQMKSKLNTITLLATSPLLLFLSGWIWEGGTYGSELEAWEASQKWENNAKTWHRRETRKNDYFDIQVNLCMGGAYNPALHYGCLEKVEKNVPRETTKNFKYKTRACLYSWREPKKIVCRERALKTYSWKGSRFVYFKWR